MSTAILPEDEYWRIFHLIRGDVEAATKCNHAYLTINHLIVSEPALHEKINKFADFWTMNSFALQTTFFISFGRLFDKRQDALSAQKLVDATIANPRLFSKAALRERKRKLSRDGTDPEWLVESIQNAWEPTTADLIPLNDALAPHREKFKIIYSPIRHRYYAHRSKDDEAAISALFGKTQIDEVNEILRFLHTLIWAIQELASNGTRPNLTNFVDYENYVHGIKRRTEQFVRQ
jgi:hypothetical protein